MYTSLSWAFPAKETLVSSTIWAPPGDGIEGIEPGETGSADHDIEKRGMDANRMPVEPLDAKVL